MDNPILIILVCFAALALVHAQDQSGFLSIDCGIPDNSTYTDSTTGIYYVSDAGYLNTQNGISKPISSLYQPYVDRQFYTVRSFPLGIKNCYTLKIPRLAGRNRYFIRTRFFYGDYDNTNEVPIFDLYFGVDYWQTINATYPVTWEILHDPTDTSNDPYVCLVNTQKGTPFISAIEVRLVDADIYPTDKPRSLSLYARYDLRAYLNRSSVRYNDDVFDRIWRPSFFSDNYVSELNTSINIGSTYQNSYKVPSIVMQTAITPLNASNPLEFYWEPDDLTAGYYIYMHFADFQPFKLLRQFDIKINNVTRFEYFEPSYLYTTTTYHTVPKIPTPRVNFTLIKTANSTLPPILNAIELYTVRQFSYQLTDQTDLNAIEAITATYTLTKDWQGDPCLPAAYSWEGIGCVNTSSVDDPRIVSLNLSSNGLTGKISLLIADLKMLQSLDLSNNSLIGEVPAFLSEMLNLKILILSRNNLSGIIPAKLVARQKSGSLTLRVDGNQNLCESSPCTVNTPPPPITTSTPTIPATTTNKNKSSKMLLMIIAIASVIVILFIVGVVFIIILFKKKKSPKEQVIVETESTQTVPTSTVATTSTRGATSTGATTSNVGNINSGGAPFQMAQQQYTYSDVVRITANFQQELGKGGFGSVYHGYLGDNQVAVKMLSSTSTQGYKQFRAEAELLTRVHHRNLTTLVGYCDEGDKQGLIYEYMAKSDLRSHLSAKNVNVLSWEKRLSIVVDAAQGLEYLHTGCKPKIIHRDIKSTNILLNNEFQAKLADFGLSKVFPKEGATHMSTGFAGTPGYLDPEYNINEKSDVFSFGIVLLEIITGKAPISKFPDRVYLYKWVDQMLKTSGDIRNVVDPRLNDEYDVNSMWKTADLAMECVSNTRPTMNQIVIELKRCFDMEKNRFTKGYRSNSTYDSIEMSSLNVDGTGMNPAAR